MSVDEDWMLRNIFKMTEAKRLRMDPGPLIGTHKYV